MDEDTVAKLRALGYIGATEGKGRAFGTRTAGSLNNEGLLLKQQGKQKEAIEAFDTAISVDPNLASALWNLSDLLWARGESIDKSDALLVRAFANGLPEGTKVLIGRAIGYQRNGQIDRSVALLNQAAAAKPNEPDVWLFRGRYRVERGECAGRGRRFPAGGAPDARQPSRLCLARARATVRGKCECRAQQLSEVVAARSESTEGARIPQGEWTMTGIIVRTVCLMSLMTVGVPQLSERDQHAAAQHFKLGMESLLADRYEAAEREFQEAVKIDPLYDAAFYGLGQVYMATKRYDQALKAYLDSREAFKAATAAEVLASAASDRRLRDQIDALKDNERNMTRLMSAGKTPNAQQSVDQVREQIQQLESRKSRRAGAAPPPVPAGLSMAIGSAYFRLNDLASAEKEYKAAVDVNPNFGEAHSNLAVVYFVTGRVADAETAIKAAERAGFKVNPRLKDDIAAAKKKF